MIGGLAKPEAYDNPAHKKGSCVGEARDGHRIVYHAGEFVLYSNIKFFPMAGCSANKAKPIIICDQV